MIIFQYKVGNVDIWDISGSYLKCDQPNVTNESFIT